MPDGFRPPRSPLGLPRGRGTPSSFAQATIDLINRQLKPGQEALRLGAPSRETALGAAGARPAAPPPRPEPVAAAAVAEDRAETDPRGQGASVKGDPGSADAPLPKLGKGDHEGGGRPRAIKMPDGRIVATNAPIDITDPLGGKPPVPYRDPEELPTGDVYAGPEATIYIPPGGEPSAGPPADLPASRDPGWAPTAALNQLYRTGQLSMDARDVADRQRWERGARAGDIEQEMHEAQAKQAIAEAEIDPMEAAQMESEGRYGGEVIEQEAMASRVQAAIEAYSRVTAEMRAAMDEMEDGPEKQQFLDRLERERRDYANIIMGHQLRDPKADPLSALAMGMLSPQSPTPEK